MPDIAMFFNRETQDFASLQGGRHHYFYKKTGRGKGGEELFLLHLHNVGFGSAVPKM